MSTSPLQWLPFAGLIVLMALLYLAPGTLVLAAAGERRWHHYGLAVPVTVTITTCTAVGAAHWGIKYGLLPVLGATVIAALLALPLRWLRGRTATKRPRRAATRISNRLLLCVAAGVGLLTWVRTAINIGHPWAPSQTYDAVYHLNVLAVIRDGNNASPWQMDISLYPHPSGFYPNGWHQVTALALPLVNDIPTLANASALAIITVIWPLALAGLVWSVSNGNRAWLLAAVLLSQALPQFPQMFFTFGSLYPNLLGFAVLPAVLAVGHDILWERRWRAALSALALVLIATPGIAISHPATLVTLGLLAPAFVAARMTLLLSRGRFAGKYLRARNVIMTAGFNLLLLVLFYLAAGRVPRLAAMQAFDPNGWQPTSANVIVALIKAATLAAGTWFSHGFIVSWTLGLILVVGAWVALQRLHTTPLVLVHMLTAALFIVADGDWNLARRAYLTGFFYADPMRLAALLAITAVPLLALGTLRLARIATQIIPQHGEWKDATTNVVNVLGKGRNASASALPARAGREVDHAGGVVANSNDEGDHRTHQLSALDGGPVATGTRISGAVMLGIAVIAQLMPGFFSLAHYTQDAYLLPATQVGKTGMLTADEYALLKRVGQHVPKDETVLGNPWTGTAFVWALADRQAVFPDLASLGGGIYGWRLGKAANQILEQPLGCEAVRERHAYWVLDFGDHYLWNGEDPSKRYEFFAGLEGLAEAGYAEVVDQQGGAKLMRITQCDAGAKEKP